MHNTQRHIIVGTFVVLAITILVAVWLWFLANTRKDYDIYIANFHEPVDGIMVNSIVKYNGVTVGNVKTVELDTADPRTVHMLLNILQGTHINRSTYAIMKSQGVTGGSFINLQMPEAANLHDNLIPHNAVPYPEIQTRPSLMYNQTSQAGLIASNMGDISNQLKKILTESNIAHLSNTINNLDTLSGSLAAATQALSETTKNTNALITDMRSTTLQNFNNVLLPNLNQTMHNLNATSGQLTEFLMLLNQNPSALIRGKILRPKGPGE